MRGIVAAVVLLLAALPAQGQDGIQYRGRVITLGGSPRAAACLELVKKGLDMAETLPAKWRALSGKVRQLHCNPLPAEAVHSHVADDVTGVYVVDRDDPAKSAIVFRRDPTFVSARDIVLSLVGNGVYAQRALDLAEGRRQLAKSGDPALKARVERLEKIVSKSDLDLTVKAECENMEAVYGTMKALGADPNDLSGLSKFMLRRGCA